MGVASGKCEKNQPEPLFCAASDFPNCSTLSRFICMRHEEGRQVFKDLSERAGRYGNILKEGSPLPLFCLVLGKGRR